MKKTRAKIGLTSLLLTGSSPNIHAQIESNTNTDLVETFTKGTKKTPGDTISFENATKHQRIKELIHKSMDNEKIKEIFQKNNYNLEDSENTIYEILTSDSGKQLLTELSHDKDILVIINNFDTDALEEKIKEKDAEKYIGMGLLILAGLLIGYGIISSIKSERSEQDPFN